MQLFYTTEISNDSTALLKDLEWQHCSRVLRHRIGDQVHFVDGKGGYFTGILVEAGKKEGRIEIESVAREWKKRPYSVHVGIAPTKQMNRVEWMLEKLVELGVDQLTFLHCRRSERKTVKMERLKKVAISAMKQSLQGYLPVLSPMITLKDFLMSHQSGENRFIAHLDDRSKSIQTNYQPGNDVIILVGPEGDFDEEELAMAIEKGFLPVHLGHNRLRTETAALAACHTIHLINQQ